MKIKAILITFIFAIGFPLTVLALATPSVQSVPSSIDADFYSFTIFVQTGAKVTVVGGPSFIPPVTDGVGNALDGEVEMLVGLAQEALNVFSIAAELNGEFSDTLQVSINETSAGSGPQLPGDHTAPDAPVLDPIDNPVKAYTYKITGSTEADANIYVTRPDGVSAGSTRANSNGIFEVTVDLEVGKTNRFNISAEDAAYNIGPSSQAVIQAIQPSSPKPEESEPETEGEVMTNKLPFVDTGGHWAESYIFTLYEAGVVGGKTPLLFEPNAPISRAELTKIAMIAFEVQASEFTSFDFSDVAEGAWYFDFVSLARNSEIVSGYDDNTFRPNEPISRAAALKILLEASGLSIGDRGTGFTDVPDDAWFRKYVAFAQDNDIVGGYPDGTFGPGNLITRAEVVKITVKLLELK